VLALLAREGIVCVEDVLARAERVRELPDRSNHLLRAGGRVFRVKRERRAGGSREAEGLRRAEAAGAPVARIAFEGRDPQHGSVVATFDLGDALPMDDALRAGRLEGPRRRGALRALARAVATLHDARLHHRDLYLNHVFVDPQRDPPTVVLIDLERVGRHRRSLGRWVVKDLAAIESSIPPGTLSRRDRARLLLLYLRERGARARGLAASLARRVARKAARLARHVPRTPVGAAGLP
jgi:hypothetical protein